MKEVAPYVKARVRECWVLARNRRISATYPWMFPEEPRIHAVAIESVRVHPDFRRQGLFKAYLRTLCEDLRFDMVVVEGVGNVHLADALDRWGWECDRGTGDFYYRRQIAHGGTH